MSLSIFEIDVSLNKDNNLREKIREKNTCFLIFEWPTLTLFLVFYILVSFMVLIKSVKEKVISVEFTIFSNKILIDLIILRCK